MKKRFISFLSGMVVGAVMFGGSVAYASGILADLSNNQIFVDGTLTPMEAYVINGHNYVKLRDIGQAVGFNVFWDDTAKCVQVESDKPYYATHDKQRRAAGYGLLLTNNQIQL